MILLGIAACGAGSAETGEDHAAGVQQWRDERVASLMAADGYLNLVGLYWLEAGANSFGGTADNDLVFPGAQDAAMGVFELSPGGVTMRVEAGVDVRVDDQPVESVAMLDAAVDGAVTARYGSLLWTVIDREGKIGVRLRDLDSPALAAFPPIPYFEIDSDLRVEATLQLYDEPRVMNVSTVIEGLGWNPESPGLAEFEIGGQRYALEAYTDAVDLFFVFADTTSGRGTYPAGRFLHAPFPDEHGKTVLDFNQSYNPPCAFNDFATCPVASPRNRLPVPIEAGEKYIESLHYRADAH